MIGFFKKSMLFAVLPVTGLLGGCATMLDGTTQELTFTSEPPGAVVLGDGLKELGVTPFKKELSKNETGIFVFKKEGYQPVMVGPSRKRSSTSYWNHATLIFYPFVDMVDELTGAKYLFNRTEYDINMFEKNEG